MSNGQKSLDYIEVVNDLILEANEDYRIYTTSVDMTMPNCVVDDVIVLDCMADQVGTPNTLVVPSGITVDGSGHDVTLNTNTRRVFRATGVDIWVTL